MSPSEAPQELRCECPRAPLLARAGIADGRPFVWVKHVKSSRTLVDMCIFGGRVEMVCRECNRTWRINLGPVMEFSQDADRALTG